MALCIKCAAIVEADDEKTVCDDCVKDILKQLTIDHIGDIVQRIERNVRNAQAKADRARKQQLDGNL